MGGPKGTRTFYHRALFFESCNFMDFVDVEKTAKFIPLKLFIMTFSNGATQWDVHPIIAL